MKTRNTTLRELIISPETLVMPDAYDALSARLIVAAGFKAVQCSGYSFALATAVRSEAALGLERNLALTKSIVEAVEVPVMADGEDGFGDPVSVAEAVAAFIRVGAAGINIEDQVLGEPPPKQIVDREVMVEKIRMARKVARLEGTPDLVINGRTDALAVAPNRQDGMEEAIARANLYLEAGADLAFVTGVVAMPEVRTLVDRIRGPVSIAAGLPNNINTMSIAELRACGVARVSLPVIAVFGAIQGITRVLNGLHGREGLAGIVREGHLCSPEQLRDLMK
jgi:2-methylisocitrate lyase-like PEP mutase family enzyme